MTQIEVTIEDAYAVACQALGESVVVQRLQNKELARLTQERADQGVESIGADGGGSTSL